MGEREKRLGESRVFVSLIQFSSFFLLLRSALMSEAGRDSAGRRKFHGQTGRNTPLTRTGGHAAHTREDPHQNNKSGK